MIKSVDDLPSKVKDFAKHCISTCSIADIVDIAMQGVDQQTCDQWRISAEQWQDGLIAALTELGTTSQKP